MQREALLSLARNAERADGPPHQLPVPQLEDELGAEVHDELGERVAGMGDPVWFEGTEQLF